MDKNLKKKFEIMSFFDNARWQYSDEKSNYYGLNICDGFHEGLNNDEKAEHDILLHWITYIAERGADFRPIWDKGAYVYSYYLKDYYNNKVKIKEIFKINGEYLKEIQENKYKWVAPKDEQNKKLKKYQEENGKITYISRYYVSDYANTILTLSALQQYNKSFLNYLAKIAKIIDTEFKNNKIQANCKEEALIKGLALGLYCLTYSDLNFTDLKEFKFKGLPTRIKNKTITISQWYTILFNENGCEKHEKNLNIIIENFSDMYNIFFNNMEHQFYNLKRIWCALRDYIKDYHYNEIFIKKVFKNISIDYKKILQYLELPGDVWNNNTIFGNCIFTEEFNKIKDIYNKNSENYKLNQLLRYLWENNNELKNSNCYPEQFDCTFDFVPRMCDSANNNCQFCPFSQYSTKKKDEITKKIFEENFNKLCAYDSNKDCTIAMICCGYKTNCLGKCCSLRKTLEINNKK